MEEYRVITKGSQLRKIGAKAYLDYISPFIKEKAFLIITKIPTLKEQKKWLGDNAGAIDSGEQINVLLFVDGKLCGNADANKGKRSECHNVEIGISISKEQRGKGLGEKLLRKTIAVAKKRLKPHKIWLTHIAGNTHARNLYKKVGFVQVASLKEYLNHYGEWRDKIWMEYKPKTVKKEVKRGKNRGRKSGRTSN